MSPFFPEHPLTAIAARQRAATAELETCGAVEPKHLIKRPVEQLPAQAILIKILYRRSGTIGDNLISIAPCDSLHVFKFSVILQCADQFHNGLFPFAADDDIHFTALAHDALICIRRIDPAVNDTDLRKYFLYFVDCFYGSLV